MWCSLLLFLKGKHFGDYQEEAVGAGWKYHWPGSSETLILSHCDILLVYDLEHNSTLLGLIWQSVK